MCVCTHLDGDAPVDPGHVDAVRLSVGKVTLVHIDRKGLPEASQVIAHLKRTWRKSGER